LRAFIASLYSFALSLGGPGLFAIAALDSSFVSLPQINDLLLVLMVTDNPAWMPYYALMSTLGSLVGCSILYVLANKGGEALLRRRVASHRVDRALGLYRRHGVLALMVPALLPPPAPFKLFVLGAGIAGVRPLKFVLGVAVARGLRYLILGTLAIYYGKAAVELMKTHGPIVGLSLAALIVTAAVAWFLWRRRAAPRV
jgi:membrane protein YqaA with SNARE-associated domain